MNLVETYIELFIKPNFISNLDKYNYFCSIRNNKVSFLCGSNVASYEFFYGYLSVPIANIFWVVQKLKLNENFVTL